MSMNTDHSGLWIRKAPERTGPRRGAGGFYRTAEGKDRASGGIPLQTANDAVVAAVRLAYKVAEQQIERSTRLANALRKAGNRAAGPHSDVQALDATEKLVMNALLSGLAWWESSVAEGRCPVKRLAAAEYRMLGSILGLTPGASAKSQESRPPGGQAGATAAEASGGTRAETAAASTAARDLQIVHKGEKHDRRPVLIESWLYTGPRPFQTVVYFYSVDDLAREPLEAELDIGAKGGGALMRIGMPPRSAQQRWKAAICDEQDLQVGYIEILL
jgi:hypothetical protein